MDDKLFGLMTHAEGLQATLANELVALKSEREALARERMALKETVRTSVVAEMKACTADVSGSLATACDAVKSATASLGFKWCLIAGAGLLSFIVASYAFIEWQRHTIGTLSADIANMKATVAILESKGGRMNTTTCGGVFCVEIDISKPGWGDNAKYRIPWGY